jgi:predicted N-formylglutamate amidohydrolase
MTAGEGPRDLIRVENAAAGGDFIIVCDHASNRVPPGFGELGVSPSDMERHIAWDLGALPVARHLSRRLDAPLIYPDASRLLIDCNRLPTARDAMPVVSDSIPVPGNENLPAELRGRRLALIYDAYHHTIDKLIEARSGRTLALVAVHSFTPVFRGAERPWHVGVLADDDRRLADPLLAALRADRGLTVGENEPYSPADGVYHTLERHAAPRRLPAVMIEVRNDLIATAAGQGAWAARLAAALAEALRRALAEPIDDRTST